MQVSVIIPVYNAEPYVRNAVESALQQPDCSEIILIEDNSPDNSLRVCQDIDKQYEMVRLLRHPDRGNHGAGATRNLGIKNARFDYVAFLDADDFYLPGRFRVPTSLFADYPGVDGVYEAIGVCFDDRHAKEKWFSRMGGNLTTMTEKVEPGSLFEVLISGRKGNFSLDGLVVRKSIFEKCGYFFEHLRLHQDTAMTIQMAYYGRLIPGRLDSPVAMRRVHSENRFLNQPNLRQSKFLFWKTLFYWAHKRKLGNKRLTTLFLNYVYSSYRLARGSKTLSLKNWPELKGPIFDFLRHPLLFIGVIRYK